jgi:integrase/recombinase XerD
MGAVLQLFREEQRQPDRTPPDVDLLESWAAFMSARGLSPASVRTRTQIVKGLLTDSGLDDPLELTRDHVIAWLGRPVKAWTRVTYWKTVKAWSTWVVDFGHLPECTLLDGIGKPKPPAAAARPINDETIARLLAMQLPPRPHAYVRLALFQALRVHEIAKVRAEDFDFTSGWLLVTGKGGITKPIPIHQEVAKLGANMPELGFWFPSFTAAGHVSATAVSSTISQALTRCGSTATAHQLRDTAATRMQRTVKDIRLTQAMLRHTNITSTMKYTEASNDELKKATRALDWQDAAQAAQGPVLPSLEGLTRDQQRHLAEQLLSALAGNGGYSLSE